MTFTDLQIEEPILKALAKMGYDVPTPIQEEAIPILLQGQDILGCASTGTGKTAAFAIPVIQKLMHRGTKNSKRTIRALILTPTRELALQIDESFRNYSLYTNLRSTVIFGGVNQRPQTQALSRGVDILTATPGRLLDLMNQGFIHLDEVEYLVLDEADRMLDMGFIHDIKRIISHVPKERQTMFFSATIPEKIDVFARSILHNPVPVNVKTDDNKIEYIDQCLYYVDKKSKSTLLVDILKDAASDSVLVFSRTKHGADKIAKELTRHGIGSETIHGNKSQAARQKALQNFKQHYTKVLIATDVAARGLDIALLPMVINYDLPEVPETYIHRIGRTGRAGHTGVALSFCEPQERKLVNSIQKLTGRSIRKLTA